MEDSTDLNDWEVILSSNPSDNLKSLQFLDENTEDGSIKSDYFALKSVDRQKTPIKEENLELNNDSDNPSWVDPDSNSRFLDMNRPVRNSDDFWSDESSGGNGDLEGESDGNENSNADEMITVGDGGDSSGGENKGNVWWKMPLELIKFCIFRVRPVWSVSIAAVMVGIVVLGRKLYRMKQKRLIVPLKIAVDDKKASHFAARSARLKAISLVRYMPLIRPSLPASGATQWAALPLR